VSDDQEILGVGAVPEELMEVLERSGGGEAFGLKDLGFVAGLGADERGGLEAALEGTRDDKVELDVQGIEDIGELEAVAFAFLIERAFYVEEWVGAAGACAGVAEDKQVHTVLLSFYVSGTSGS
jgi:hypothetical protein